MTITTSETQLFDKQRAGAFADRLINALNEGALCLMASIGHRTGLFDAMATMPPSTSVAIAERANLNERYVREWLGAMTTSGVVEHNHNNATYYLPNEHASFLTRQATPDNIAVFAQYIPLLGAVEDDVVRCFQEGGGVPYAKYTRFHEVMAEDSGQTVLSSLLDHIIPLLPDMQQKLQRGIRMLDVGCGSGRAINLLADKFTNSEFVGIDLSLEAIARAQHEARLKNLGNVKFFASDLSRFDEEAEAEQYDLITTFDAVHDQAKPLAVLKGIARSLKPDGVYLMQDIHGSSHVHNNTTHPIGSLLYTISCMHCMTVSLAQGGEGLGAMWGQEKARQLLAEAGFNKVSIHQLEHDFQNDYYVISK